MKAIVFKFSLVPALILTCILLSPDTRLNAQTIKRCGTAELVQQAIKEDPALELRLESMERELQRIIRHQQEEELRAAAPVYTIPVVFHVLFNNGPTDPTNIADAQILSQIEVLNEDYRSVNADITNVPAAFNGAIADAEIEFCLAAFDPNGNPSTGITRTQTNVTVFHSNLDDAKFNSTGGHDIWDRNLYLNIWVVPNLVNSLGTSLVGYAQFPGVGAANTDGVVVVESSVGRPPANPFAGPYNEGRTATHEIGHWLNLIHIWGDDCPGTSQCSGNDNCGDTPNQQCENYGCATFPLLDLCSDSFPGVMFMNFMDYGDDDCIIMFTNDQRNRMRATLTGFRSSVTSSAACCPFQWYITGVISGTAEVNYRASDAISSTATIQSGASCVMQGGNSVTFTDGFHAAANSHFLGVLDGCDQINHAQ